MKKTYLASRIIFNITTIAAGVTLLGTAAIKNGSIYDAVGKFLKDEDIVHVEQTGKPAIYNKTWYQSVEDVIAGNGDVAKATQSEGTVLLKNSNNALPLDTSKDKVSLYGVTAYDPIYSLDGAGEVKINKNRQQFFFDEFKNVGLTMNEDLANWYNNDGKNYWRTDKQNIYDNTSNTNGYNAELNGASWSTLPASKLADDYKTGIFVTGRITNEGIDILPGNVGGKGAKDNDYLKFTDNELSILQGMKDAKTDNKLDKIVVIINSANPYQEDLPELFANYNVDAALWIGHPGSNGIEAVADILVGKSSPSAGLSTTWYTNKDANPSTAYYGKSGDLLIQEGVYIGYKYAETRYEDTILATNGAGDYAYGDNISYPFGYGLSYSSFRYNSISVKENTDPVKNYTDDTRATKVDNSLLRKSGDDYIVEVEVENTGNKAAKEIVQIYVQKSYTASNKTNGVEKPSVELIGFGKTSKLEPGQKEVVTIEIDANKYFASYDGVKGDYVVDSGTYYLAAARNSHQAVNSILMQKKADGVANYTSTLDTEYGEGNTAYVAKVGVSDVYSTNYKYWTKGELNVKSLFDSSDPNKAGQAGNVKYMSRNNWVDTADNAKSQTVPHNGTMDFASYTNNRSNQDSFDLDSIKEHYPQIFDEDSFGYLKDEQPTYGQNRTDQTMDGTADTQLYEMRGIDYDDPKWEEFMNQLTAEEIAKVTGNGLRRTVEISSIGKPYTNDVNASNAISWMFDMSVAGGAGTSNVGFAYHFDPSPEVRRQNPTGYPCEGVIAATFNKDIAYAVGQAIGEDGLWTGSSGLYGFGLGLHRNPYHGRTGEYYSDDPFLTGIMGGYETKGAQSKGMYVYNKHFVLNDQETNRTGYKAWLSEQTMRETYLRPFELAIEIGNAMNVMSSFNNIGSTWSGNNYNLMTEWLRGEADMKGFIVTDYWRSGGMNLTFGMLAGTDLPDGNNANGTILKFMEVYGFYAQAARQSAKRILYTVANSNAMNFYGEGTTQWVEKASWPIKFDRIVTIVYSVFALSAVFMAISGTIYYISRFEDRKKEN